MRLFLSRIVALVCLGWSLLAVAGYVDVEWIPPTENVDGSPANLSGYIIEYRRSETAPVETVTVTDPSARAWRLTGIDPETLLIVAMRAVGDDGQTSEISNVVRLPVFANAKPRPPVVVDPESQPWPDVAPIGVTGRHFTRAGVPLFWLSDTAWFLIGRTDAEIDAYLVDRKTRGFHGIQGPILIRTPFQWGGQWPYGFDGNLVNLQPDNAGNVPLISLTPVVLNEPYWRGVDRIVRRAGELGLTVILPISWGNSINLFADLSDLDAARELGRTIAARYAGARNVTWMVLGEYNKISHVVGGPVNTEPTPGQIAFIRALAEGVRAGAAGSQLVTIHPDGWRSSSQHFHGDAWLQFNTTQSYQPPARAVELIRHDYGLTPPRPTFDGECGYETTEAASRWVVRLCAWQTAIAGAAGFTYGASPVWSFDPGWQSGLDLPGAGDVVRMAATLSAPGILPLSPDRNLIAVPGDLHGNSAVTAARTGNGRALVYSANGGDVVVNRAAFGAGAILGRWIDPRTGAETNAVGVISGARITFDPPGVPGSGNDWVLMLSPGANMATLSISTTRVAEDPPGTQSAADVNLTQTGTLGWFRFGESTDTSENTKSGGVANGTRSNINTPAFSRYAGNTDKQGPLFVYSDGASPASGSSRAITGTFTVNAGTRLDIPLEGRNVEVFIWSGGYDSTTRLAVSLTDGSATSVTQDLVTGSGKVGHWRTRILAQASDAGASLRIDGTLLSGVVAQPLAATAVRSAGEALTVTTGGSGSHTQAATQRAPVSPAAQAASGSHTQAATQRAPVSPAAQAASGSHTQAATQRAPVSPAAQAASGSHTQAATQRAPVSLAAQAASGSHTQGATQRAPVSPAAEAGSGGHTQSGTARYQVTVAGAGQGAETVVASLANDFNVTVTTPAVGGSTVVGALSGDLIVDVVTGASGASAQSVAGRFVVTSLTPGSGAAAQGVVGRFGGALAESALAAIATSVAARLPVSISQGATGGHAQTGISAVPASVVETASGAGSLSVIQRAALTALEAAVGSHLTAVLQRSSVTVSTPAVGAATVSAVLDSERFELAGDVYIENRTVVYRIRSIRRR